MTEQGNGLENFCATDNLKSNAEKRYGGICSFSKIRGKITCATASRLEPEM